MKLALSGPKPASTPPPLEHGQDDPEQLLVEQGVFLNEGRARWQLGQLCLTGDRLRFVQPRGAQFDIPLTAIVGLSLEQKSFVAVHKTALAVTFQLPSRRTPGTVWFITPRLGQWLTRLTALTAGQAWGQARGAGKGTPVPLNSQAPGNTQCRPHRFTAQDVERLARTLEPASQELLWHLWLNRHAPIQELAKLIAARSHMEVLLRIRQEINPAAQKLLGRPILVFEESRLDPETGQAIAFCWWLAGTTPPVKKQSQAEAELFDEADKINIVVELLGVAEQALRISVQDSKVVIWTEDAALSYYEEIGLPAPVDAGTLISQYINGVLSINLRKV